MFNFFLYLTMILFLVVCVLLTLIVLIQKGRGGGLASAFGGGGGSTAFGTKTGDVLTWATSIIFAVFLLLAVGMNLLATKLDEQRTAVKKPEGASTTQPAELPAEKPASTQPN